MAPIIVTTHVEKMNADGIKYVNNYQLTALLASTNFGKVKKCINIKTNKEYAIKIYNKFLLKKLQFGESLSPYDKVLVEIDILKRIDHPSIIHCVEVINDEKSNKLYLIFEFCTFGTICTPEFNAKDDGNSTLEEFGARNPLDAVTAKCYFIDILNGLEFLHNNLRYIP